MNIILWYSFVNVKCRVCLCCSNKWYYIFNITILSFRDSDEKGKKNISEEFYWEYKLILFYLYSWHIFIIKRCFTFQYKCTYNLILHNKSSPDLQLGTIEKKTQKSCLFDFSQRQTNVFSLSRQATDRQMFKETNGDFSDSITFNWYE